MEAGITGLATAVQAIMDARLPKEPWLAHCWGRLLAASSEIKAIADLREQRLADCWGLWPVGLFKTAVSTVSQCTIPTTGAAQEVMAITTDANPPVTTISLRPTIRMRLGTGSEYCVSSHWYLPMRSAPTQPQPIL